ncbi:MAG TPA: hypothetical protein VF487_04215 [Chitinophagaceae bacterium]
MKLFQKFLQKLNGLRYSQEYLCFSYESFEHPVRAWLVSNGRVIQDITTLHSFVGYHPLIFAIAADIETAETIDIIFSSHTLQPNDLFSQKDAIATLSLKKINEQPFLEDKIILYEGCRGKHRFVSSFHQSVIGWHNRLYQKKPGNVFLAGNLYKQVQIAYALPRNISLITMGQDNRYNLFPTDLHGPAGEDHYIISLRWQGKACRQVEQTRNILVTQVHSDFYRAVYKLGKNHMQELKGKEHFPFSEAASTHYQLPIPLSALQYRELELQDSFIYGIHKLMLFKIISRQVIFDQSSTLSHIHNVYATWRHNNHLPGNYLLR